MISVKLKFRASTLADKEGAICIQLIHNRKIKLITTRFRVYPQEWNSKTTSVQINSDNTERKFHLQSVHLGLRDEMNRIGKLIVLFGKRTGYTVDEFADYYSQHSFDSMFFPFMEAQITALELSGRRKTAIAYGTAKRSFSCFLAGKDINLNKIDANLISDYETYLKNNGLTMNSSSCYMRVLRAVYNQSVNQGLTTQRNPFKKVYTGIDKTIKRAVSEDIIRKLKNCDLEKDKGPVMARDIFMFSFYTRGMAFVDMANLKKENLKNGYITYVRSKTKQMLTIKVEKCMEEIIFRYKETVLDDYLLPIYNKSNLDYSSHLRTYNKRLKRISELLRLEKPLSSYVARHSWATLAFRKGVAIRVISEGMGHQNENTTRIYLGSLDRSIIDKANALVIALK